MINLVFCNYIFHFLKFMRKFEDQKNKKNISSYLQNTKNWVSGWLLGDEQVVEDQITVVFFRSPDTYATEKMHHGRLWIFLFCITITQVRYNASALWRKYIIMQVRYNTFALYRTCVISHLCFWRLASVQAWESLSPVSETHLRFETVPLTHILENMSGTKKCYQLYALTELYNLTLYFVDI